MIGIFIFVLIVLLLILLAGLLVAFFFLIAIPIILAYRLLNAIERSAKS